MKCLWYYIIGIILISDITNHLKTWCFVSRSIYFLSLYLIWLGWFELDSVIWPPISLKMYYIQNKERVWSRVYLNSLLEVQPVTEAEVSSGWSSMEAKWVLVGSFRCVM